MNDKSKIYVAGHKGMVGSAILRNLIACGYSNIVNKNSKELDLTRQTEVECFFETERPEFVFLAAAKVGGIQANITYPAEFIYQNLMIEANVIHCAYRFGVKKLLFLGSSCIYPKLSHQPIKEEDLMTGPLEPSNEAYAISKIAGIELCKSYRRQYGCNFISVMPTNLYGYYDNFDLETSHVIPALLRKFHEAKINGDKKVEIWGTGTPRREFLFADDLADACIYLMRHYNGEKPVNIGTGKDLTIRELAEKVKSVVGYKGQIINDVSKPDGTLRKQLDIAFLKTLGWQHRIELEEGLEKLYQWYVQRQD